MLFRYRARNWPATLSKNERQSWDEFRTDRIKNPGGGGSITLDDYRKRLAHMMVDSSLDERGRAILSQLADWPAEIGIN
jgi:exodeoxyribonuclease-1